MKLTFKQPHFLLCSSCFWCASDLNLRGTIETCPACMNGKVESMPISHSEICTFRSHAAKITKLRSIRMRHFDQLGSNIIVYIKIPDKSLKRIIGSSIFRIIFFLSVCVLLVTTIAVLLPISSYSQSSSNITSTNHFITNNSNKIIILSFDDNRKGDFTFAKPILDKYGFKATFFIICGKTTDKGAMNWQNIVAMQRDGMDIESHTMTHKHLNHLSANALNFEIAGSKQCLANHGYNVTSFAYPYDEGADNVTVVNTVAKNYELARSGSEPLMFLKCNGFKNHPQTDCRTHLPDGTLAYANKYAVRSLSFDRYEIKDLFSNSTIFSDFVKIVNSQIKYNNGGTINAVPLVTFHNVLPLGSKPYSTNVAIFDQLMKYLHDNGFRVLSMNNLGYDAKNNVFYIKSLSG